MLKKRANVPGETAFFEGGRLSDGKGILREPKPLATLSYEVLFCVLSESGVWEMGISEEDVRGFGAILHMPRYFGTGCSSDLRECEGRNYHGNPKTGKRGPFHFFPLFRLSHSLGNVLSDVFF